MPDIDATLRVLGRIARVTYPASEIPAATLSTLLTRPATGLALLMRVRPKPPEDQLGLLLDQLPADLRDPAGGVPLQHQWSFWAGWYGK